MVSDGQVSIQMTNDTLDFNLDFIE